MRKGLERKGFQGVQGQQEWLAESMLMVTLVEDLEMRQMQGYIYRCMTRTRRTGKHPVSGTDYRIYILGFHGLAILRASPSMFVGCETLRNCPTAFKSSVLGFMGNVGHKLTILFAHITRNQYRQNSNSTASHDEGSRVQSAIMTKFCLMIGPRGEGRGANSAPE